MSAKRDLPKHAFLVLAVLLPLAALAQTTPATPVPSPTPVPSASPSVTPSASPSPAPSASATPSISPSPSPTPTPLPTPLVLPPDAVPQILAVTVNETVFHSGDTIVSTVITSTNVAAVELRILGRAIRYPRTSFGVWQLDYKMPHIPRRYLRDYNGQIAAMNTAGVTTVRNVVISLR